ncbi:centrosomal protein of 162 kDa isoform X2 [Myripristis murdjan]|uniref:centrosomal protein of 162 kDa isoform X2 n=1 Tax=Myripristis murdjan TaxID=586833 RepID=UPI001176448C|nr:centrosomal protein of 162 kDa isoform X2 [Myripristis murdjan]
MSHRLTKEELDEQFELFLKESVSDDSLELGGTSKQPSVLDSLGRSRQKPVQKPAVSTVQWWQDDDDSEGGPGRVICVESSLKPVPKPRSKALDMLVELEKTHKAKLEARHGSPVDDSDSQRSPTRENPQSASGERSSDETSSNDSSPACSDSDSQGSSENGLLGCGKTFRKSLKKPQPIQEEDEEEPGNKGLSEEEERLKAAHQVAPVPTVNTETMGLDTLEEEEEKAKFFAQLEAGASSTVDYSKLNRELDSTSSTIGTTLRKASDAVEQSEDDQREGRDLETDRNSPGSSQYSEDFEDEGSANEPLEEKPKGSPMLAKVSLHDSLDSIGGEDRKKDPARSLDKGQSYVQSGGSEVEALHEAYRQISHAVDGSDDHNRHLPSLERRGRSGRTVSPSSPPQHAKHTLQPASTTDSELPTAEELMRPIRPEDDYIRGFTLQPISGKLDPVKISGSLEQNFPESKPKPAQKVDSATEMKGSRRLTSPPSCSPDLTHMDRTWSIREEVERLMQDQDKPFTIPSIQASKAKKQWAHRGSTMRCPSTSSAKRHTVAPVKGRRLEARSAVASRLSGPDRPAAAAPKPTKSREADLQVSSELIASVQSFAAFLQHQIDTSSHQETTAAQNEKCHHETRHTQQPTKRIMEEESSLLSALRVQLAQQEKELQLMQQHKEELSSLKQQNYVLQSKLRSAEEASQKRRWAKATDPVTEEKLKQIDKEMQEQETLIKGYQQENEKLYVQMKSQQVKSKANEEAMFTENQRLLNELASMREQWNKTSRTMGNVCPMDHTQRITELLAQMNTLQRNEAKLLEETHRLKQEKQALQVDLQLMKQERDLAKAQAVSASENKSYEMHVQEDRHKEEVAALKKKLHWFAENQDLLDRDASRLKAATAETQQLKEQVEKLKMDVGKRDSRQQSKTMERAGDARKIQDLEQKVKELQQILRQRNPNSLPALIYAAVAAGEAEGQDTAKTSPPSRVTALLERRIQRLEAELESHDEEAKRSLRAMEQQFQRIKLRYEQQISELEQQLVLKQQLEAGSSASHSEPRELQVQTLKEELQQVKETHQNREKSLEDQIQSLQQQLNQKAQPSPSRHQRQAETALGVRLDRLNQELATKTRTIQELSRTVDRLQKERKYMLSVPSPRQEARSGDTKRHPAPSKAPLSTDPGDSAGGETFPAMQCEKAYQPTAFTGSHITEVLQENEALRQRLELLELQKEQEKESLKASAKQAQDELRRLKEQSAEQLASLTAEHLRELDRLRANHALEHSTSKVAELTNTVNTQEIMVKHLRDQVKELQGAKDALAISKIREDTLQNQVTKLLEELKQAKEAHSPELKHFCSLEKKILNMELRHQQREKELQQAICGSLQVAEAVQQSEQDGWKRLAQEKSRELETFRLELDSILDVLRQLHRQGVILPTPDPLTWKS